MPGGFCRRADPRSRFANRREAQPSFGGKTGARRGQRGLGSGDVLDAAAERALFPDSAGDQKYGGTRRSRSQRRGGSSLQALAQSMRAGRGERLGANAEDSVSALRTLYAPPWELALQQWMESVALRAIPAATPAPRARGADRRDVVLPGRKRESWTLNVVLDTSGSMVDAIPPALGAIGSFCEAMGVDEVRLLQCDADISADDRVHPAELASYRIRGFGGSDLSAALRRLADDGDACRRPSSSRTATSSIRARRADAVPGAVGACPPASQAGSRSTLRQSRIHELTSRSRAVKAIHQMIEHFRERGRLSRRQLDDLTAKGYWGLMQPDELRSVERKVGQSFSFQVSGNNLGPLWGTDVYTSDSNLGTACVHAGLLKIGETGPVKVTIVEPVPLFQASTRNGITSQTWQTGWGGAFTGRVELTKASRAVCVPSRQLCVAMPRT